MTRSSYNRDEHYFETDPFPLPEASLQEWQESTSEQTPGDSHTQTSVVRAENIHSEQFQFNAQSSAQSSEQSSSEQSSSQHSQGSREAPFLNRALSEDEFRRCCSVLDLAHETTGEEVRAQFRRLVRVYHPDRFSKPQDKVYAAEKLRAVNEAYKTLTSKPRDTESALLAFEPNYIQIRGVPQGKNVTATVQIRLADADAQRMQFSAAQDFAPLRLTSAERVFADRPSPLLLTFSILSASLALGSYRGWLDARLGDDTARLMIDLELEEAVHEPFIQRYLSPQLALTAILVLTLLFGVFYPPAREQMRALPSTVDTSLSAVRAAPWEREVPAGMAASEPLILFSAQDGDALRLQTVQTSGVQGPFLRNGYAPSWSPVGRRLLFTRSYVNDASLASPDQPQEQSQLSVATVLNGDASLVLDNVLPQPRPLWAPNGLYFAYAPAQPDVTAGANAVLDARLHERGIAHAELYGLEVVSAAGGPISGRVLSTQPIERLHWWPDSKQVLVAVHSTETDANARAIDALEFHLVPALTTTLLDASTRFSTLIGFDAVPFPDGSAVIIAANDGIYAVEPMGRILTRVNDATASALYWSPRGDNFAYCTQPTQAAPQSTLHLLPAPLSSEIEAGTPLIEECLHVEFAPDGESLAIVTGRVDAVNASGAQARTLYLWHAELDSVGSNDTIRLLAEINDPYISWVSSSWLELSNATTPTDGQ